ncbi:MAG: MBL fold metallo-hydrolase, partial [Tepidiformaceae bacterium]
MTAGVEPLELARDLDLGRFSGLHDPERLVPNLHRAYAEARGEPRGAAMNFGKIFGEMLEYNGGKPLTCWA